MLQRKEIKNKHTRKKHRDGSKNEYTMLGQVDNFLKKKLSSTTKQVSQSQSNFFRRR